MLTIHNAQGTFSDGCFDFCNSFFDFNLHLLFCVFRNNDFLIFLSAGPFVHVDVLLFDSLFLFILCRFDNARREISRTKRNTGSIIITGN